jgi:hypothetical protein
MADQPFDPTLKLKLIKMFPRPPLEPEKRAPEFMDQPPNIKVGNLIREKVHGHVLGRVKDVYWANSGQWCVTYIYEHTYYNQDGSVAHLCGGHEYANMVEVDLLDRLANEAP